jgi:N6-adenosine-specific RNA methylase IME4
MRRRQPAPEPFRTIVADCPWPYGDKLPGKARGVAKNYRTMPVDQIARYLGGVAMMTQLAGQGVTGYSPEGLIAKDARLFLWRVHPMQEAALHVMRAWGFGSEPVSELVWNKTTMDEPALFQRMFKAAHQWDDEIDDIDLRKILHSLRAISFGMGRTFRLGHEVCLVGRRGRPKVLSKSESSVLFAPVREHSQKPEEFFERVERVSPGPYLELFSGGHRRAGWTSLGYAHYDPEKKNDGESVVDEPKSDQAAAQ